MPGEFFLDPRPAELAHPRPLVLVVDEVDDRLRRSSRTSFGRHVHGGSPADTRVSLRSKATTGSSNAMYSIVLFIVETSLSGFFGSGDSPISAVDMTPRPGRRAPGR